MHHQQQTDTSTSPYYHPYYPYAAADQPPASIPIPSTAAHYASAPPQSLSPVNYTNSYDPNPNPDLHYTFPHSYPQNQNQNQNQAPVSYDYGNSAAPVHNHVYNPHPSYEAQFSDSYGGGEEEVFDGGVYKYNGGGKAGGSGGGVMFDDYGRPISVFGGKEQNGAGRSNSDRIVKAVPKVEDSGDARSGVQKFRVKILSEGYGQADMDVLCQIGLDGIWVLDPETSRMLKIYPLDTVLRWEVLDSYIFAFWARTGSEPEKRVRMRSNSYTTNNILDTVTAASIQSKEIGADSTSSGLAKGADQSLEKKRGFIDWKNIIKPVDEEKDHWVPDEAKNHCSACRSDFSAFNRKHHCRNCGDIFCDKCTQGRIALTGDEHAQPVRVCDQCMAEVTQRLTNSNTSSRNAGFQSHEDLAKKLQEEMDKKRKTGSKTEASNTRMREVACPTCTVHLQVVVPASGSETIECSVCQHPFLVNAN